MRRHLREFAVVVFGVAAALAAENWRESRQERSVALEYLERLEAELQEGAPTLRVHQARVDSALEAISALLGQSGDPRPLTRADSISLILVASNYGFNPAGVVLDLTYREMMATGSLNHVKDREVRDAITRYFRASYRLSDVLEEQREAGVREWADRVAAATGGSRRSLREDPLTMGLKSEERLLDVLRADASAEQSLRVTQSGLLTIQRFLRTLVEETDALLGLGLSAPS